jgi:hypothetical protein
METQIVVCVAEPQVAELDEQLVNFLGDTNPRW